jgi:hypothetical protein
VNVSCHSILNLRVYRGKCRYDACSRYLAPSRWSRWWAVLLRPDRKVPQAPLARLAPPAPLVLRALRVHRVRKDPSVHRVVSASRVQLVLPALLVPSDPKARRAKLAVKAQLGLLANAVRLDHRAPQAQLALPVQLDRRAQRGRPVPRAPPDRAALLDHRARLGLPDLPGPKVILPRRPWFASLLERTP